MDGIHDMGGMQGFGRIPINQDTVFDHNWQKRAFALAETLAWSVPFDADQHRRAIEQIAPVDYLRRDYFEKWAIAVQTLLLDAGLVDEEELRSGRVKFPIPQDEHPPVPAETLVQATRAGAQMTCPETGSVPAFAVDQAVRVRPHGAAGHTRVPRYVRGHIGRVVSNLGFFQFADAMAVGKGPAPQFCYTVEFEARTLWGEDAQADDTMFLDLWEPYLESA
ncbi:MAG: nitrile hydratase subunit beta [Paracoccaceae bacterium]